MSGQSYEVLSATEAAEYHSPSPGNLCAQRSQSLPKDLLVERHIAFKSPEISKPQAITIKWPLKVCFHVAISLRMFLISKQSCRGPLAVKFWGLVREDVYQSAEARSSAENILAQSDPGEGIFAKHRLHSQVLKSVLETKQTFPVHICLLLAKYNFLFERKG